MIAFPISVQCREFQVNHNEDADMNVFRKLARPVSFAVIISLAGLGIQIPAYAAIVGTDGAIQAEKTAAARDRINTVLAREDVQKQLVASGVDPKEVKDRVNAMTDNEVLALNGKMDEMAAGGDALGVAVFVFLLLIVTDLLGWTKIFPFTKKGAWR